MYVYEGTAREYFRRFSDIFYIFSGGGEFDGFFRGHVRFLCTPEVYAFYVLAAELSIFFSGALWSGGEIVRKMRVCG